MNPRGARRGAPLFGALVGCYLTALVVAGVHGELLAGLVVGAGLVVRLAARRLNRLPGRMSDGLPDGPDGLLERGEAV